MKVKRWFQSLTVKGLGTTALTLALAAMGADDAPGLAGQVIQAALVLGQVGGLAVAMHGRWRAEGPLSK